MRFLFTAKRAKPMFAALLVGFLLSAYDLSAQVNISGKVTNKEGQPVSGAVVSVKGTDLTTTTFFDGNFTLLVPAGKQTIEVNANNYKASSKTLDFSAGASGSVDFVLAKDPLNLDEVIVSGTSAGTTRKQIGSYIGTVKGEKVANAGTPNALAGLQGKVAGAQIVQNSGDPAGGMSVRLRGLSTIGSSSEPLYIIDGVMINNSNARTTNAMSSYDGTGSIGQNRMVDINPNDIERIEVLNGAAAAATYGSRANAGVVQIFTKRGSTGKPTITFTSRTGVNSLRKRLKFNQSPTVFGPDPEAFTQDILTRVSGQLLTTTSPVTRYDYQDLVFRNGVTTDNSLSVSGGKDKSKYFSSINYNNTDGIVNKTNNQRLNFRINYDLELHKKFSISSGINYVYNNTTELPDGNTFFSPINSMTIIGNHHNIFNLDPNGNPRAVGNFGRVNPVSIFRDIDQKNKTNRIITNLGFKYRPANGLTVDYMAGLDNINQAGTTLIKPYTYFVNPVFFGGGASLDPSQNGYASAATYQSLFFNHDLNLTYVKDINSNIQSTTQLGYSEQYEKGQYLLAQSRGLGVGVRTVLGGATLLPSADSRTEQSIRGFFLQQNFKLYNSLFVTLAGRLDGSSVFSKENRNNFYPKASISYQLGESKIFEKLRDKNLVNSLKVRLAYGESGNLTGIGPYERFNTYSAGSYLGRSFLVSSATRANDDLRPERQKELELGTDISFLDNRINFTLNVYNKKVVDLLIPNVTVAPSVGFTNERRNVGTLTNKGFEILLSASPVRKKDFEWTVTGLYNRNTNKIGTLGGPSLITFSMGNGSWFALIPGQPAPVFYLTHYARDNQGKLLLNPFDGNGNPVSPEKGIPVIERGNAAGVPQRDPATGLPFLTGPNSNILRKNMGTPNPKYTATLTNSFTYQKYSVSFQLDRVAGNSVFNADFRTRQGVGNGSELAEKEHRGLITRGTIERTYPIEEWRLEDGSFTKLREISISYNYGAIKKIFNNVTFTVTGRNLYSWDTYRGYDPETNSSGQNTLLRGIDFGNVPIPRTIMATITAKF